MNYFSWIILQSVVWIYQTRCYEDTIGSKALFNPFGMGRYTHLYQALRRFWYFLGICGFLIFSKKREAVGAHTYIFSLGEVIESSLPQEPLQRGPGLLLRRHTTFLPFPPLTLTLIRNSARENKLYLPIPTSMCARGGLFQYGSW